MTYSRAIEVVTSNVNEPPASWRLMIESERFARRAISRKESSPQVARSQSCALLMSHDHVAYVRHAQVNCVTELT